jgi:hypothetical protein
MASRPMSRLVDDILDEQRAAAAAWLDGVSARAMAELLDVARGVKDDPRVAEIIHQQRRRVETWHAEKLDELHAAMLREINRLD